MNKNSIEIKEGHVIIEMGEDPFTGKRRRLPFAYVKSWDIDEHIPLQLKRTVDSFQPAKNWENSSGTLIDNTLHCVDPRRRFLGFFETIWVLITLKEYRNAKKFVLDYFIPSRRIVVSPKVEEEEVAKAIADYNERVDQEC